MQAQKQIPSSGMTTEGLRASVACGFEQLAWLGEVVAMSAAFVKVES
jgi:hypothetical protein